MIVSFGDKTTRDIYDGVNSKEARKVPKQVWSLLTRKLDMLNAAHTLLDLSSPPGNRLEALKGKKKGFHSIRVNDQYRVIFQWVAGNPHEVQVTDYH